MIVAVQCYKWARDQQINALELRTLFNYMRPCAVSGSLSVFRVATSACSKWRSSSLVLNRLSRRLSHFERVPERLPFGSFPSGIPATLPGRWWRFKLGTLTSEVKLGGVDDKHL